ncbi:UDP-N-acetylglucosamine 2-epimerase [Haloplanus litoreus]|uniref:UDP-N-acetylglucosamine 2-epimerase n=1 Tax=Haloplanus litoreus TaxID=767515 RepID=A0ABD5ZXB3_9EURY
MSDRSICVVTGTRAEYGLLQSPMEHIKATEDLQLQVVATGMHLSPRYGNTYEEIEADGFDIDRKIDMLIDADSGFSMAKSTGIGMMGLAEAFRDLAPDIVLILGDRDEPLAAGIAAAHMNIPVAHIHGGDVMVGAIIDDSIRYALTKFAHIHFPASDASAERISRLGEEEWRIHVAGAPGVDAIIANEYEPPDEVREVLGIDPDQKIVLCVQHPVTTQPDQAGRQMQITLDAIEPLDAQTVLIYPNSDAGGKEMIETIENHPSRDEILVFKNLSRSRYLGLMDAADVMVGNSSSGIIEAPSFDLPAVDIGLREQRRQRAPSTKSVDHDREEIRRAVEAELYDEERKQEAKSCENPYDYGGAGEQIAEFLADVTIDDRLLRKNITY